MSGRLLVLTAMRAELAPLLDEMDRKWDTERWGGIDLHHGFVGQTEVMALATGVGKVRASAATQYAIGQFAPSLVLFIGAAGALGDDLRQGQAIVGAKVVEHDFDMRALAANPSASSGRTWIVDPNLSKTTLDAAQRALGVANVRLGTILTGDQVVADPGRRSELRQTFGGDCVEMEGAAVASVCHLNKVAFTVVRIVSDRAGPRARRQFVGQLPSVGAMSLRIINEILREDDLTGQSGKSPQPAEDTVI